MYGSFSCSSINTCPAMDCLIAVTTLYRKYACTKWRFYLLYCTNAAVPCASCTLSYGLHTVILGLLQNKYTRCVHFAVPWPVQWLVNWLHSGHSALPAIIFKFPHVAAKPKAQKAESQRRTKKTPLMGSKTRCYRHLVDIVVHCKSSKG